jgi:hypothetical protein
VHGAVQSQIAVGDGNVQIQLTMGGMSQFGQLQDGVALRKREIPVFASTGRTDLVGRDVIIEQAFRSIYRGTSVQLFGAPGVGRKAIAEAVTRRLGAAGVAGVQIMAGAEPHTLESVYRRLVQVFFGAAWFQPDEAVLRVEVARADLRALIVITDCDLQPAELGRLLGTFPQCRFLLTSRQRTLEHDVGAAYEVDPLTPGQARELITRVLGTNPAGLQNLQAEEAWRLADGHVQRLLQHAAFLDRTTRRPGATGSLPVPLQQQVAILVAGLSEPARRALIALSTFGLALDPAVFSAVTGLPEAAHSVGELLSAGLISPHGAAYRISPDAAMVLARGGERTDPQVAADGLMALRNAPDPHLLLAVARALRAAGHDAYVSRLVRAAAPLAMACGEVEVWIQMVALGTQSAVTARRKPDLEYFLNEQHTGSLLRGDTVAAAAALAALGELLAERQPTAVAGPHQPTVTGAEQPKAAGQQGTVGHETARARQARRALRQSRHGRLAGHPTAVIVAAVGVVAIASAATATIIISSGHPAASIVGAWNDGGSSTFTFTASGPGTYTVSEVNNSAPQCTAANDGTVTGDNGHYKGSVNLYSQGGNNNGKCEPKIGVAQITIAVAAKGGSASVNVVGNDCPTCKPETWTKQR